MHQKRLELIQGTPEWLEFRRSKVTASEAAAIMGKDPWTTALQLYNRKIEGKEIEDNESMRWGRKHEPIARKLFEEKMGMTFEPQVIIHPYRNFIMASLDGISQCGRFILELKCPKSEISFGSIKNIGIPEYYYIQAQTQLACKPEAEKVYHSSILFDESGNPINEALYEIKRDEAFIGKIEDDLTDFWDRMQFGNPPEPTEKDFVQRNDFFWNKTVEDYLRVKKGREHFEEREKELKNILISLCEGKNSEGSGVRILQVVSKGRIDYTKVEELNNVNLDKYRKEPTKSWRVSEKKSETCSLC